MMPFAKYFVLRCTGINSFRLHRAHFRPCVVYGIQVLTNILCRLCMELNTQCSVIHDNLNPTILLPISGLDGIRSDWKNRWTRIHFISMERRAMPFAMIFGTFVEVFIIKEGFFFKQCFGVRSITIFSLQHVWTWTFQIQRQIKEETIFCLKSLCEWKICLVVNTFYMLQDDMVLGACVWDGTSVKKIDLLPKMPL